MTFIISLGWSDPCRPPLLNTTSTVNMTVVVQESELLLIREVHFYSHHLIHSKFLQLNILELDIKVHSE